jgi:hypothetical protein
LHDAGGKLHDAFLVLFGGAIMSWRNAFRVKGIILTAAVLALAVPQLRAGDRVHTRSSAATSYQTPTVIVPAGRFAPFSVSVTVVAPAQPAQEPLSVDIRGTDGLVRRFPVEGGQGAIQTRQLVLRPGESVSVQIAAK